MQQLLGKYAGCITRWALPDVFKCIASEQQLKLPHTADFFTVKMAVYDGHSFVAYNEN